MRYRIAMTGPQRAFCLASIHDALSALEISERACLSEAVELEHAAYIHADQCTVAYPFAVMRVIHLLETGNLLDLRGLHALHDTTQSYVDLLNLPSCFGIT